MSKTIHWMEQQTEEWFSLRAASIGGSKISKVSQAPSTSGYKTYLNQFISEMITGVKYRDPYTNRFMDMGVKREPGAAMYYSLKNPDVDIEFPGMVTMDEHRHVSPDFTIGLTDDGCERVGEIKSVIPTTHIATGRSMQVPTGYRRQCNWEMFICGADICDFISWCPEIKSRPMIVIPYSMDKKLIGEMRKAADKFIKAAYKGMDEFIQQSGISNAR